MDVKGGYVIIDLKGQTIGTSGAKTTDTTGAFAKLDKVNKPIILTNFIIDDNHYYNAFVNPHIVDSEITLTFLEVDADNDKYVIIMYFDNASKIYYESVALN